MESTWSKKTIGEALTVYYNKVAGLNDIYRRYHIPKATLKQRIDDKNKNVHGSETKVWSRCRSSTRNRTRDSDHVLDLERNVFGITRSDLRKLAVAEANKISHTFNNKQAGKKWHYCKVSRH